MLDMHGIRLQALCSGCVEDGCEGRSPTGNHSIKHAQLRFMSAMSCRREFDTVTALFTDVNLTDFAIDIFHTARVP